MILSFITIRYNTDTLSLVIQLIFFLLYKKGGFEYLLTLILKLFQFFRSRSLDISERNR